MMCMHTVCTCSEYVQRVKYCLHMHARARVHTPPQVYSTGRNLGINLWWIEFKFKPEDCPEGMEHESVVSLKDVVVRDYLQVK